MAEKKEHKIVEASETPKTTKKKVTEAAPKGNAGGLRAGAIVLWVVGLVFEILALLIVLGKINLNFIPTLWQLRYDHKGFR